MAVALIGLLVTVSVAITGCQGAVQEETLQGPGEEAWAFASGVTVENYPRVNGSTSTRPLGKLIIGRAISPEAELFTPGIGPGLMGDAEPIVGFPPGFRGVDRDQLLRSHALTVHEGTHQSYLRLLGLPLSDGEREPQERRADLALIARGPSEDELAAAEELGFEFDVRPLALDAFVFIVNEANPVRSLGLEQLRSIFKGDITSWADVGGNEEPIKAFTRDRNSGSEELMRDLVMNGEDTIRAPESVLMGMMGPVDTVAQTPNAIAYSVYYYEEFMRPNPSNRLLAVDGIVPSAETIASGEYPFTTKVFVVTRSDLDPDIPAARLRDWLLTEDGQKVVADSGYVPIAAVSRR
jgi:phosphate transport system substrate-binding protein